MSIAMDSRTAANAGLLTFDVGGANYALPIDDVREIVEYRGTNSVPGSSSMVHGVFNYSGTIVPVVDLGAKFGGGRSVVTKRTCIVIVAARHGGESLLVGLLVDAVREVVEVGADAIEPAPAFGSRVKLEYLRGLVRTGGGLTIVLEVDRFLSAAELMGVSAVVSGDHKTKSSQNS